MIDESRYLQLAETAFRRIADAFDDVDPDVVDVYTSGDVLTLAFANGVRAVLNTQRPTRQVWLAARAHAWHFGYDSESERWMDDKGRGELFATLTAVVKENGGIDVTIAR
ncbi:MAG: iron donor protein CyaY [Deltaproteobacteria bacterium]